MVQAARNMRAFIHLCRKNQYLNGVIELVLLKEDETPVISLTHTRIQETADSVSAVPGTSNEDSSGVRHRP